jgi:Zn finger protein HypA/HybF involved in hydrogenase expression
MMDKLKITSFEVICASCNHVFASPILSDFSYGQYIFCSEDGMHYAHANAFEASAKLIYVLLPEDCGAELFWFALASLADKIHGKKLYVDTRCPRCGSANVKRNLGKEIDQISVSKVTYGDFVALPREDIIKQVKEVVVQFRERKPE